MKEEIEDNTAMFAMRDDWYARAKTQTVETLPAFMAELTSHKHDYSTVCYAVAAAALAAAWSVNSSPNGGITGFQAGAVMWEFIQEWQHLKGKPLRLVNYGDMLFPQYADEFTSITQSTADYLKAEATKKLEDNDAAHPDVIAHWRSVAAGIVPFGFVVRE